MSDPDITLIENPMYSVSHVFNTDDITVTFAGDTVASLANPLLALDTTGANGTKSTQDGNTTLYPINSEFGFLVTDFDGAENKDFFDNPEYTEGWAGNLLDESQQQAGIVVSDAPTDTFKTPALLGTWLAGLGGNTVKASTEHYVVMQNVLSDQRYPGDPDAEYALDNDLKVVGGDYDGYSVADLLTGVEVDGIGFVDVGDVNGDGVEDIKDILSPNESSIKVDIAASTDYSVTLKDDGKLLYRWGNTVKRPNDIRLEVEMELPEEWSTPDESGDLIPLYRITAAELVTEHTITNNPNDQIRPEDYENEAAIGQLPTYAIVSDYNEDGNGPREVWVTTDAYYAGDGTLYPAGTILRDDYLAEIWANSEMAAIGAQDGAEGFTNAWYTTMDREPFTADYDTPDDQYAPGAEYDLGPRWRLQTDKYGQDLPSVVIPSDPSLTPPPSKDEVKYEVGADTTTVINLLDWGFPVSPLSISAGWQNGDGSVTENGVTLSQNFDVAFYIKGDIKPATLYNTELRMNYEEIAVSDLGSTVTGGAGDDYLVGKGGNTFDGGDAGEDFFVLSYGLNYNLAGIAASTIIDFEQGEDVIGLIDLGLSESNFDTLLAQTVDGGDLRLDVGGIHLATLTGVTEALDLEDFLLLNRSTLATMTGTSGDDYLVGDATDNLIEGLDGNDTLFGSEGNDTLLGGRGSDFLFGQAGSDSMDGGDGWDFVSGGSEDDILLGGSGNDRLYGNEGSDEIFGGSHDDLIYGGATGNDTLNGEDGSDTIFGESGADYLTGGAGADSLYGGTEDDQLLGGEDDDLLEGGAGNDMLYGGPTGQDTLLGGQGSDFLFGEGDNDTMDGGDGFDLMNGGAGDDLMLGGNGNDRLEGNLGADTLDGGAGDDRLYGGNGIFDDTLIGGAGNDTLSGEAGNDVFVFADGFGVDEITDFNHLAAGEVIDLEAVSEITDLVDLNDNHISQAGADVLIEDGLGNSITVRNVLLNDLGSDDFFFG